MEEQNLEEIDGIGSYSNDNMFQSTQKSNEVLLDTSFVDKLLNSKIYKVNKIILSIFSFTTSFCLLYLCFAEILYLNFMHLHINGYQY